jgi:hypothetical protein
MVNCLLVRQLPYNPRCPRPKNKIKLPERRRSMKTLNKLLLDWILPMAAVLVVAMPNLDHAPSYDEVLHYDAALGMMEHGESVIAQGVYPRAALYTALVAASFQAFGVSDVAARVPSVLASMVWALLLYAFIRQVSSRGAAWIGIAIFLSVPPLIQITQMCRFYTLHGLSFFIAALALFAAVRSDSVRRRVLLAVLCVVSLAVALHLQMTTVIGTAALAAWLFSLTLPTLAATARERPKPAIVVGMIAAIILAAALLVTPWDLVISIATETPYWASWRTTAYLYYARSLGSDFGFVWLMFPFLAIVAYRRSPSVVWFSCAVLAVALVLHSLAGPKDSRYISYAFPFVCIVAGIALADVIGRFRRMAAEVSGQVAGSGVSEKDAGTVVVILCIAFLILMNPNTSNAVSGIFDPSESSLAGYHSVEADWRQVIEILNEHARDKPTLVASSGTKALFYIGYYDYELNLSVVYESETGEEFGRDPRTGGLVIAQLESFQNVISCSPRGLAIIDESKWRTRSHVTPAVADFIEATLERVAVPEDANLLVFKWENSGASDAACDGLPRSRSTMDR